MKGSRHHRAHEEYDIRGAAGRSSRDYPRGGREKDYHHSSAKDRDRERERERDREREREKEYVGGYRSGRHHRDYEDERVERRGTAGAGAARRSSRGRGVDDERSERGGERERERGERGYGKREWDDPSTGAGVGRERSGSVTHSLSGYREEGREKRPYDERERGFDERVEKVRRCLPLGQVGWC